MLPTGFERILSFAHPLIALGTIFLLYHVASLGLRSRQRGGSDARSLHARRTPWVLGLVWLSAMSGIAITALWRDDLTVADGTHVWIGMLIPAILSIGALLSRRVPDNEYARKIHPAIGLLALLLAAVQVFFGLPLLPF